VSLGPLFEAPPSLADSGPLIPGNPRERLFWRFHFENPHVYELLRSLAFEALESGAKRVGVRLLWERARWSLVVETRRAADSPKLNDWYPPFYARPLMRREPALRGLFETRDRAEERADPRALAAGGE
jgi:hypothetical protein